MIRRINGSMDVDASTVVIPRVRRGEWEMLGVQSQSQICHFLPWSKKSTRLVMWRQHCSINGCDSGSSHRAARNSAHPDVNTFKALWTRDQHHVRDRHVQPVYARWGSLLLKRKSRHQRRHQRRHYRRDQTQTHLHMPLNNTLPAL
jgi:hypothetical protein